MWSGYQNILHMTIGGNSGVGQRIPGLFPSNGKVLIYYSIDGTQRQFWSPAIPLNEWVHFKFTQHLEDSKYVFRCYMDHRLLKIEENKKPEDFKQVDIWLSDNWHNTQPGFVKNLFITGTYETENR